MSTIKTCLCQSAEVARALQVYRRDCKVSDDNFQRLSRNHVKGSVGRYDAKLHPLHTNFKKDISHIGSSDLRLNREWWLAAKCRDKGVPQTFSHDSLITRTESGTYKTLSPNPILGAHTRI